MTRSVLDLDPGTYRRHPLHLTERIWTETNCYVDVWVELLHALGLDPVAAGAFALDSDFDGSQWTFFKYPPEDLRAVYGIEVAELNVWRPVLDHVEEHLARGRLLTVEADSWFLPDTQGVSYRLNHQKSTIIPQRLDRDGRRLDYFHNAGYFHLEGDDFDGVFRRGAHAGTGDLDPYVEVINFDRLRVEPAERLTGLAVAGLRDHLARRPATNPMPRFRAGLDEYLPTLAGGGAHEFHLYAFGTCRQCGAAAEFAATFVDWLGDRDGGGLGPVAAAMRRIAEQVKALEFLLARLLRGRTVDLDGPFASLAEDWESAMSALVARYGG